MNSWLLATLGLDLVIVLVCLAGAFCCSGFENGMLSIRRARLEHAVAGGDRRARRLQQFLAAPHTLLATILLGNNLCMTIAAIYSDQLQQNLLQALHGWGGVWWLNILTPVVLTVVLLVCSEITPKLWFRQNPLGRCLPLVPPLVAFTWLAYPLVRALTAFVNALNRLFPSDTSHGAAGAALLRDDFRLMLLESEQQHLLDREARLLLDHALDYHENTVRDRMVPRAQVIALSASMTLAEAVAIAKRHQRNRFPVTQNAAPDGPWSGIFTVYDAIFRVHQRDWATQTVADCMRPPVTIRDDMPIAKVLPLSRLTRSTLLIVVDAAGQQRGIITPSDILAPLFGAVQ